MIGNSAESIIKYGKYFANPQISLKPIRQRQDEKLVNQTVKLSQSLIGRNNFNKVKEPLFFVGSVDFMVKNENGRKTYYVLEANGGNSRGFSALPISHWKDANKSYAESLNSISGSKPVVIVGHPSNDLLLYEKIFLAEQLEEVLRKNSNEAEVVQVENLTTKRLKKGNLIILGPYEKILPRLSVYKNNYVYFDGKQVDVLIGDGIARRKPEIVKHLLQKDLKTIVVNDVFFITDDKSLTYLAVQEAAKLLANFDVVPIKFKRAVNKGVLVKTLKDILNESGEVLIKPHGGSGGSGIDIIAHKGHIDVKVDSSIKHYQVKFGSKRNPFPYTVCQRVKASPVVWNKALHHFDIRIYVGRKKDRIVSLGALMRIALEPFAGRFTKKSFVVNLSGYEGVDTDRGFGLTKESLALFNLDKGDFAKMFAAACSLSAYINNNYSELLQKAFK